MKILPSSTLPYLIQLTTLLMVLSPIFVSSTIGENSSFIADGTLLKTADTNRPGSYSSGDLTNISDNPAPESEEKIFYTTNELIDVMDWDYGIDTINDINISPVNGAMFGVDGPLSGTGWWDIGICWADPDLYPPTLDLSTYDAAAIRVTNLAETGVTVKMYINFGWDHTGGNSTRESNPWTILASGETRLFIMNFEDYDIDRPNEIVKLGVHLGMNGPDDDPNGYYPLGSQMHVLVTGLPNRGDFEPDGDVDFFDFAVLASSWQSSEGDGNWNLDCDISEPNDGIINEKDLAVFVGNWLEVIDD